jgi:hypothetical protein
VEFGDRGHRCDAFATQLRQLLTLCSVDVDEAVHVAYAKALHAVLRELLPLRSQSNRHWLVKHFDTTSSIFV